MNFLEFEGQLFRVDAIKNVSEVESFERKKVFLFTIFYGDDHYVILEYATEPEANAAKDKFFNILKDVG